MRRILLLTCIGFTLVCFPGCHHWKKKHLYHSAYAEGDACGCGSYIAGAPIGAPAAFDTIVPGPGAVISAPSKAPLAAPQF